MVKRLKDFKEKISIKVTDNPNKSEVRVVVNEVLVIKYINYAHFFEELRLYYINIVNSTDSVRVKKAICFDAMHSFSIYQEVFNIYNNTEQLRVNTEFHESYFKSQYSAFKELDILPIINGKSKYPSVFVSNGGLESFKAILVYLNKLEDNELKDGYKTVVEAIRKYEISLPKANFDKKIMKHNVTVKNIVDFLNSEFNARIKYNPKFKFSSNTEIQYEYVEDFYNKYL